jgi:signal transduction histidine kinase
MLKSTLAAISLILLYSLLWHAAALFEYAPFASLWYAPAGLSVAILLLWKKSGFVKVWLCVYVVSIVTQYSYVDSPDALNVLLVSFFAAFGHTIPYWVTVKAHNKLCQLYDGLTEGSLLGPILFPVFLFLGSIGAATLGILVQVTFAQMPVSVGLSIWLSWWVGDYVAVIVLAPLFVFLGVRYFSHWIEPENSFLVEYSATRHLFPKYWLSWLCWVSIVILPSLASMMRAILDSRLPVGLMFFVALLPIAILATRNTWGVMISASVLSSITIIISAKLFGMSGDAIEYQFELLTIAVTILYFYYFVSSFKDRTEALLVAERSLGTASRLFVLNEVSANIAHEMSTPLQAALSSSQRVRRRLEKREGDWSLEIGELNNAKLAIGQAGKTLNSVRNLVRTNGSNGENCLIESALSTAFELINSITKMHGIRFTVDDVSNLPEVGIEKNELVQILLNLISNSMNSLKSNSEQKKEIFISGRCSGSVVWIELFDGGDGIEASTLNQLFMVGASDAVDGLGLGLWVSKSIAERRGGTLEYIEKEGGGWCFRLSLKCTRGDAI